MDFITVIKSLKAYGADHILVSFAVTVLVWVTTKLSKISKLKHFLPFIYAFFVYALYETVFKSGVKFDEEFFSGVSVTAALSFAEYHIFGRILSGKKINSLKLSAIISVLEAYGAKNAEELANKIISALTTHNSTDSAADIIKNVLLSENETLYDSEAVAETIKAIIDGLNKKS